MTNERPRKNIQSVQRAIDIINCFDESNVELTPKEISGMVGINISTTYGLINTLVDNDFLVQNRSGKYMLGQAFLLKANYAQGSGRTTLIDIASTYMSKLAATTKLTANLFIIEQGRACHLLQETPAEAAYLISQVSDSDPLYATATGKLVLAHMMDESMANYLHKIDLIATSSFTVSSKEELMDNIRQIRALGYSYECEELGEGISAISVPLYTQGQKFYGAISLTGTAYAIRRDKNDIVEKLKSAAAEITGHLMQ